jgi:DNA-binding NtrC family response regulator
MSASRWTALVVDDEALLRAYLADLLEDDGFEVLEADSAEAALRILESRADEIALLFSDIRMPGMSGIDLLKAVQQRWPHIRLILSSGDHRLHDDEVPDHGLFVPKPASPERITEAVRRVMA